MGVLFSTRPVGRKKLVPKWRSRSSIREAPVRAGKASRPRMATRSIDHNVSGMRSSERPFVRRLTMVVTKLRPPMVNDAMKKTIPTIQKVCPVSDPGMAPRRADNGGYDVQPPAAAPEPTKNEVRMTTQPHRNVQ